ncbi:MAG: PAS domain S-box protein, partial [Gemmatimonadota bacterium]|nr:PAS domain S-box protein [Gemmatimonadota bacterium]
MARAFPTGLRRRLIFLVVASVVPFLLLIGMVARRHLLDQKPLATERAVTRTRQVTERLNHELRDIDAVMHTAITSVGASSRDRPANDSMLRRLATHLPDDFPHWVVYTSSGQVIGSSASDAGPLEPAHVQSLWESKPAAAGSFVTEPIDTPRSARVVHVMLPMRDTRGDSALLVAQIRLASLQESLRPAGLPDLPDGSTITVISEKGVVLARSPDADGWVGRNVSASRPARTSSYHDSGTGELVSDDGVHRLIAFSRLESAPWRVYTGVPLSSIYAQARWDFGRAVGYGGLALALALGLATWQASRIIDPLTRLSADAAKLGTGNLAHRTGVLGADELGVLGSAINQMAATLEHQGAGLRESEERYRELFDINPLPMWVFDADTLIFLAVNRAAIHAYGYSEQEFMAMKITEIRPPKDIPILMKHLEGSTGVTSRYRTRHQRKDGTTIEVESASGVITFGGRPARMVVANDVSDRIRAEDALREAELHLRQSQRLEAVGQLTGGIAHDFNNVLTAIGSYSDFLYESLDAD